MKPITAKFLASLSTKEKPELMAPLAAAMNEFFPLYAINTEKRQEHFLCQALHEADGFRTLQEYATGDAYDTRTDLGNTAKKDGDGRRYKGHGIFQTTGRTNHKAAGEAMGIDAIAHPELLATPRYAVWSACIYWKSRKLNELADADNIRAITKKINGGYNGLADRQRYLDKVRLLLTDDEPAIPSKPSAIDKDSPSDRIKALQKALKEKNYNVGGIDGKWGKMTRDAVMSFKADNNMDTGDQSLSIDSVLTSPQRVLEMRAAATIKDLRAKGSTTVDGADKVTVASTLMGGGAALSQFEVVSDYAARAKAALEPFQDVIAPLLHRPALLLVPIALVAIFYAHRVRAKRLAEYKIGKAQ